MCADCRGRVIVLGTLLCGWQTGRSSFRRPTAVTTVSACYAPGDGDRVAVHIKTPFSASRLNCSLSDVCRVKDPFATGRPVWDRPHFNLIYALQIWSCFSNWLAPIISSRIWCPEVWRKETMMDKLKKVTNILANCFSWDHKFNSTEIVYLKP